VHSSNTMQDRAAACDAPTRAIGLMGQRATMEVLQYPCGSRGPNFAVAVCS
jgi:hypothetical protein